MAAALIRSELDLISEPAGRSTPRPELSRAAFQVSCDSVALSLGSIAARRLPVAVQAQQRSCRWSAYLAAVQPSRVADCASEQRRGGSSAKSSMLVNNRPAQLVT